MYLSHACVLTSSADISLSISSPGSSLPITKPRSFDSGFGQNPVSTGGHLLGLPYARGWLPTTTRGEEDLHGRGPVTSDDQRLKTSRGSAYTSPCGAPGVDVGGVDLALGGDRLLGESGSRRGASPEELREEESWPADRLAGRPVAEDPIALRRHGGHQRPPKSGSPSDLLGRSGFPSARRNL
jgi:hypothetical protein